MRDRVWEYARRLGALAYAAAVIACMGGPGTYSGPSDFEQRVEKYGDTVQFEFKEPEGATYTIDGRDYKVGAPVKLRAREDRRPYPMKIKDRENKVFWGEIEVWLTNAGTKMGLIVIDKITNDRLSNEVVQGIPLHITPSIMGETIAVMRIGNRPEIDEDSVLIQLSPGEETALELKVDREPITLPKLDFLFKAAKGESKGSVEFAGSLEAKFESDAVDVKSLRETRVAIGSPLWVTAGNGKAAPGDLSFSFKSADDTEDGSFGLDGAVAVKFPTKAKKVDELKGAEFKLEKDAKLTVGDRSLSARKARIVVDAIDGDMITGRIEGTFVEKDDEVEVTAPFQVGKKTSDQKWARDVRLKISDQRTLAAKQGWLILDRADAESVEGMVTGTFLGEDGKKDVTVDGKFNGWDPRANKPRIVSVSLRRNRPVDRFPYEFKLSPGDRQVRADFKLSDDQVVYASISVLNLNEWTRISKVVVNNIDARAITKARGGTPNILVYQLGGTRILEVALGNRPPD